MTRNGAPLDEQTKFWHLRRLDLVAGLSDAEVKALCAISEMRVVERGAPVYQAGEASDRIFLLESGSVKLSRAAADGKEIATSPTSRCV